MRKCTLLVALGAALIAVFSFLFGRSKQNKVEAALAYGRLAQLPAGAQNIHINTAGSLFSRTFWLTFTASDTAIYAWVRRSPSLAKKQTAHVSPAAPAADAPAWFATVTAGKEDVFLIAPDAAQLYGTVWIDWARGTVYIQTSHS
ncbi:hypothetical protein ACFQ48_14975 [Hymenobacter caeli]|uniref:Uncharacterized protein n=1 Tax=Hymenobacter caeli TaxID=2735894 RepID=A0ABX2FT18_9BACT|nr:hypothetical protein [Hymenobacter caeli]NRT19626.1 hypothetical protein [Hymenobacter caeli]